MDNLSTSFVSFPCPLTDKFSWNNNCIATNTTNGVDRRSASGTSKRSARGELQKPAAEIAVDPSLPSPFSPTLQPSNGSTGLMKTFILPGEKTGVVRTPQVSEFLI